MRGKFPKVLFNQGSQKFEALDPKEDNLVNSIYNSPNPTNAVKKLEIQHRQMILNLSIILISLHIQVTQKLERNYLVTLLKTQRLKELLNDL